MKEKDMRLQLKSLGIFMIMALLTVSCASRKEGWFSSNKVTKLSSAEKAKIVAKAKKHWAKRIEMDELKKSLVEYEKLAKSTDDNLEYLIMLTRGYYLLADAHYTDMDQKKKTWEKGTSWGEKAMAKNPKFAKAMKDGGKVEDNLNLLGKKHVGAMYWTAANLGKWAKNTGIATTLKYKNRIRMLIKRVQDLNPKYFFYAANRYWGAYYSVAPSFAGGDMNKSKKNFQTAINKAGSYLGTRVLYAQLYATKKGDKKLFKAELNKVLKANPNHKEIGPENKLEQKKAKKLLADMEDLF
jgi:hypothetical protein